MHLTFSLLGPDQQLGVWGEVRTEARTEGEWERRLPPQAPPTQGPGRTSLSRTSRCTWLSREGSLGGWGGGEFAGGQGRGSASGCCPILSLLLSPCPQCPGDPTPRSAAGPACLAEDGILCWSFGHISLAFGAGGSGERGRDGLSLVATGQDGPGRLRSSTEATEPWLCLLPWASPSRPVVPGEATFWPDCYSRVI